MKPKKCLSLPASVVGGAVLTILLILTTGFRTVKRADMTQVVSRAAAISQAETHIELSRMTHIDSEGQVESGTFVYITRHDEQENDTVVIHITEPERFRGESVLVRLNREKYAPECYYYFPDKKHLKKIKGKQFQQNFSLSMWSLEDLIIPADSELNLKEEIDEKVDDDLCSVVKMEFKNYRLRNNSAYSYRRIWISKKSRTPRKTVFYDKKGDPVKTAYFKDYRPEGTEIGAQEVPFRILLEHHGAGSIDIITTLRTASNVDVPDKFFNPDYMNKWNQEDTLELIALLE